MHQVPSNAEEHEKDSDDDPNIDAEHQNSPLARPGSSCRIHCRNIKLGVEEKCLLNLLAEGGNIGLPNARPRQTRDEAGGDRIADDWGQRLKSACSSQ